MTCMEILLCKEQGGDLSDIIKTCCLFELHHTTSCACCCIILFDSVLPTRIRGVYVGAADAVLGSDQIWS